MPLSSVLGAQSLIKPGVCTSSTRPASPYEGQTIYETDTDLVKSYDGSNWVTIGPSAASPISALGFSDVSTSQSTSSTSYTDLTTAGPTVTATTGTTAIIVFGCQYDDNDNAGNNGFMSVAVSGASTVAASDTWAAFGSQGLNIENCSNGYLLTGLTAGSNTFTAKYKKSGGTTTANFQKRWLMVIAS